MPEQTTTAPCGLLSTDQVPVPLAGVSIAADIRSLCARVTVAQRYVNREPTPIAAVYVFPLDENAAVMGLEYEALRTALPIEPRRPDTENARRAWATALALAWLRRHAADREDIWHLLADKAGRWLTRAAIEPEQGSWGMRRIGGSRLRQRSQ